MNFAGNAAEHIDIESSLDRIARLTVDGLVKMHSTPVKRAIATLMCLDLLGVRPPEVFATAFECVHFEWSKGKKILLVEFAHDGSIDVQLDDTHAVTTSLATLHSNFTSDDVADIIAEMLLTL